VGEFVPEDVTAVSADEWWVLGTDGAGCVTGCTRILHTTDGGQTFGSIPTPPAVVAGLRFVNPEDGWAYGSSTVWATHDGGAEWNGTGLGGTVEELETSGDYVYAIVDDPDAMVTWTLDRSPITGDSWQVVTTFGVRTANLNVHGGDVWVSESSGNGSDELLASTKDGEEFTPTPMCDGAATVTSLAASPGDIWVVCSTAPAEAVWLSTDGGQTFTEVQTPTELGSGWSSIAGASASTAVLAGTSLELTVDGGQSFRTVLHNGDDHWSIVGFTNPTDGFALSYPSASSAQPNGLWRTDDAGASWYEVELP
jgi:hypothetical protein